MQPYHFRILSAIILLSIVGQTTFADQQNNDSDNNLKTTSNDKHPLATEYTLPTIVINYANHLNNGQNKTRNNSNAYRAPISVSLTPNYANQSINYTIAQRAWINSTNSSAANPSFYLKGQRASVLLNGIPLNQFNSQAQNISLIPQNSIEKIDINPTASSVLYGGMGLGGTIDIEQKFIAKNQYIIGLSGGYPFGAGVNVFINQLLDNQKSWSLQLANNSQSIDGYRDYSRNNSNNAYIALMHQTNTQKFTLNFSDSYQYLHFPGALKQSESDDNPWQATNSKEKYINHTINTQLNFEQTVDKQWQFNLKSQYQQQWANAIFADSNYSSKQGSSLFYLRPSILFDNNFVKNTFGSEFNTQSFRQSATTNNATQTNIALFNQSDFTFNKNWQSGIGGRFEHSYTTGDFISSNSSGSQVINIGAGNIYLQYNWNKAFNTRVSASYAYQLPFIDQSNITPGTTTSFGLNPQTAWIYQLDNNYKNDKLTLKNSTYWMLINNQIDYDPSYPVSGSQFPGANINLPPTQTIGNLFALDYTWLSSLSIGGSFALNLNTFRSGAFAGINTDISNNQVPGQPPFTAEIHSHWQLNDKLSFWLQEQYYSASYAYGDYTNTLGKQSGYFLTNLGAKYQLDHWQFNFNIYNLFNKFYYNYVSTYNLKDLSYYPADGIVAMLNIQYQF
ncbi:TonB-dependent receptor [Cysteiniphilum halobium]|uniref:TonB-dependent receptor n=1 Tax=Cysteiniphilum halobium TaxID=2219059 RepID=UPI000E6560E1|nr:TonB-dependent receptor [Cysteiniphilum halobium]